MSTRSLEVTSMQLCTVCFAAYYERACHTEHVVWLKVRMGLRRRGLLAAQAVGVPAEHRGLGANAHREAAQGVRVLPSAVGAERGADARTAVIDWPAGTPV